MSENLNNENVTNTPEFALEDVAVTRDDVLTVDQAWDAYQERLQYTKLARIAESEALDLVVGAAGSKTFTVNGTLYQVRKRHNKELGMSLNFLCVLKSPPGEGLAAARQRRLEEAEAKAASEQEQPETSEAEETQEQEADLAAVENVDREDTLSHEEVKKQFDQDIAKQFAEQDALKEEPAALSGGGALNTEAMFDTENEDDVLVVD